MQQMDKDYFDINKIPYKKIDSEEYYQYCLRRVDSLMRIPGILRQELNAVEANELNVLVDLIQEYEEKEYPIE